MNDSIAYNLRRKKEDFQSDSDKKKMGVATTTNASAFASTSSGTPELPVPTTPELPVPTTPELPVPTTPELPIPTHQELAVLTPPELPAHVPTPAISGLVDAMADLKQMVFAMSLQVNHKLDFAISELAKFKDELADTRRIVSDLQVSVADTSARVSKCEAEFPATQQAVVKVRNEVEEKLLQLEIHDRKLNLLFYGIPGSPDEDPYKLVQQAFASLLRISPNEAAAIPLVNVHRLPTKPYDRRGSTSSNPDPIIVRFAAMKDRDRVLRAFEQPAQQRHQNGQQQQQQQHPTQRLTVRTDLPAKLKRERGRLAKIAYDLRKSQHLSTRIKVIGTQVVLQTRKNTRGSIGGTQGPWATFKE